MKLEKIVKKIKKAYRKGGVGYLCKMIFNFFIYNRIYDFFYPIMLKRRGNKIKRDGLIIHLNPNDDAVSQGIFRGNYEIEEIKLFKEMLHEDSIVIDIGANIGYYSLIASKYIGKKGKVYAFEPVPENYELLVKNIKANNLKNIIPIKKAVYKENTTTMIYLDKYNKGSHSIVKGNIPQYSGIGINIKTIKLDDFLKENKIKKVDVIKIDTQGSEEFIFEGMKDLIKNNADLKILTEFWLEGLKRSGSNPKKFLDKIKEDFEVSIIGDSKRDMNEFLNSDDEMDYLDLLLQKKSKLNRNTKQS